jgi:predicted nucleic acid-binding protein
MIDFAALPDAGAVFALAQRHQLTFYDACYLELAMRERIALATLDQALVLAATAESLPLIGA